MSIENEPPVGQHEWDKGGARGRCSRCGARASLAMGGFCSWTPSEEKPKGEMQAARKANLNIAVSVGGARFKSEGEATERLAFAVWTLVRLGDEPLTPATDPEAEEFSRAAAALLGAAGRYHAALEARRAAK